MRSLGFGLGSNALSALRFASFTTLSMRSASVSKSERAAWGFFCRAQPQLITIEFEFVLNVQYKFALRIQFKFGLSVKNPCLLLCFFLRRARRTRAEVRPGQLEICVVVKALDGMLCLD